MGGRVLSSIYHHINSLDDIPGSRAPRTILDALVIGSSAMLDARRQDQMTTPSRFGEFFFG
jgi:hypothetical protein